MEVQVAAAPAPYSLVMQLLRRAALALFLITTLAVSGTVAVVAYRFGWDCVQAGVQPGADGIGPVCKPDGWTPPDDGGTVGGPGRIRR